MFKGKDDLKVVFFDEKKLKYNLCLGIKGLFLIMGTLGAASMREAVFSDVGVSLIAILNAIKAMKTISK